MKLFQKALLGIVTTVVILGGTLVVLSRVELLGSYADFENRDTRHHVDRARSALDARIENINAHLNDWAAWDPTYRFMSDRDPVYLTDNFAGPVTYKDLGLHLAAYVTPTGEVVHSRAIDSGGGEPRYVPFPKGLSPHLQSTSPLIAHPSSESRVFGILLLEEGTLLLASQPIVKGSHEGPILGALVWGRFLTPEEIQDIAATTHLSVTIERIDAPSLTPDMKGAIVGLLKDDDDPSNHVRRLSEDQVAGYALLRDLYGRPALVLRVDTPRTLHRQGLANAERSTLILVGVCILFGGVIMVMLRRIVLTRLGKLSQDVVRIGESGDLAARVSASGHDELALLAGSINNMMARIECSQAELRDREALRMSEEQYRSLVESSPMAVLIVCEGEVVFANAPAIKLVGAQGPNEVKGKPIQDFLPHEALENGDGSPLPRPPQFRTETRLRQLAGTHIDVELMGGTHTLNGRPAVQFVIQDVSARKQAEQRLNYIAYHDLLTGLPNRLLFTLKLDQMLARARKRGEQVLLLMLDLDRFKEVNDQAGYAVGDRVIIEVANRLREAVRATDLVARSGEDDFFVVCPLSTDADGPDVVAQRMLDLFASPIQLDGQDFQVTSSIGLAVFPADGDSAEALTRNVDTVMYRAKASGGNCYDRFETELGEVTSNRRAMRAALRTALASNELKLHYQPQVDTRTQQVVGVEALLRWNHPVLGAVSPAQFIPIAEETGIIVPITEWVLRTALEQVLHWRAQGLPQLQVAVNLSANHFKTRHRLSLVRFVRNLLEELKIDPGMIELELTESEAMQNLENTTEVLGQLHEMGIALAIDDFGTGHSSLAYLERFPLKRIKIDRSFVQDVDRKSGNQAVIEAIMAMAHALDLEVVAEGVETGDELQILHERGCTLIQGYLFGKPLSGMDFVNWYWEWLQGHQPNEVPSARPWPPVPQSPGLSRANADTTAHL